MMPKTQSVVRAEQILAGEQPARGELDSLAKKLKEESKFKWARHIFEIRLEEDDVKENLRLQLKLGGQLALCTYKDPDLPVDERLDGALAILKRIAAIDPKDQETLGLFGAVHKRRWETFARKEDLERSLSYYLQGYEQGPNTRDPWYPGINAAYILDLLAAQEASEEEIAAGKLPVGAEARLTRACEIREDIAKHFKQIIEHEAFAQVPDEDKWWPLVTAAEALFGLGRFSQAQPLLDRAAKLKNISTWQQETTTRQLSSLTQLRRKLPAAGRATAE